MTHGDEAECKIIARGIVESVLKHALDDHVSTCPHGRSLLKMSCVAVGIALGSGVTSGGVVIMILNAIGVL